MEWIVWTVFVVYTVLMFLTWLIKKPRYKKGHFYDTKYVITLFAIPKQTIAAAIILTFFIFVDLNKLHLLWIYPVIYFFIAVRIAKWVIRKDAEKLNKKIENNN